MVRAEWGRFSGELFSEWGCVSGELFSELSGLDFPRDDFPSGCGGIVNSRAAAICLESQAS